MMELYLWVKSVEQGVKETVVRFDPMGDFTDIPRMSGKGGLYLNCSKEDTAYFEPGRVYRVEITATGKKAPASF